MEIKELRIQNYKSIRDLRLLNPNAFSVFVGPNAAGKSNIFEALEFYVNFRKNAVDDIFRLYPDTKDINAWAPNESVSKFELTLEKTKSSVETTFNNGDRSSVYENYFTLPFAKVGVKTDFWNDPSWIQFYDFFSKIFARNLSSEKIAFYDEIRLSSACGNLEKVLKRILKNRETKEEIVEWLQLLIPGFENIEIVSEELSGSDNLLIYEKGTSRPFSKRLISDGTYNIIAILTAVYQSDSPQFLLIEEPENGINPKVVKELVNLFRAKCEEKGHFIWLTTHSQTLVSQLKAKEVIIVEKKAAETTVKQITDADTSNLPMDEAWLTNTLGGRYSMVNIGFICEGETEKLIVESENFQEHLRQLHLNCVKVVDAEGNGNLLPKNLANHLQTMQRYGAEKIVILSDLDAETCIAVTKDRIGSATLISSVIIAVKAVEAWFLADSFTLSALFGKNYHFPNPETPVRPFDEIRAIFKTETDRGPGTSKLVLARKMLNNGFSVVKAAQHQRCDSAKYFILKLAEIAKEAA